MFPAKDQGRSQATEGVGVWEDCPVWGFTHLIQFSTQLFKLGDIHQFMSEGHSKAKCKAV